MNGGDCSTCRRFLCHFLSIQGLLHYQFLNFLHDQILGKFHHRLKQLLCRFLAVGYFRERGLSHLLTEIHDCIGVVL